MTGLVHHESRVLIFAAERAKTAVAELRWRVHAIATEKEKRVIFYLFVNQEKVFEADIALIIIGQYSNIELHNTHRPEERGGIRGILQYFQYSDNISIDKDNLSTSKDKEEEESNNLFPLYMMFSIRNKIN